MKKTSLLIVALLYSIITFSQKENKVSIGIIDSLYSKTLGEERTILVHLPKSAQNKLFSKQKYPVVYLLDGDSHFAAVVGMIEHLSTSNGNTLCPEMIVVGINNTDRTRDLTPSHVVFNPLLIETTQSETSGGGDNFINFIEKELIPYIDTRYPTAPYKMLIGHSLGGLMVMDILTNHTNLFNSYLSIDPSMWWDNKKLLNTMTTSLPLKKLDGISLYLACANTMPDGMDFRKVTKDSTKITQHIRAIVETDKLLKKAKKTNLNYKFKYYNEDTHSSVPLIAEYDALRFIFDFYELKLSLEETKNTNLAVINKIEKHYTNLSENFGYTVLMPEDLTNNLGYRLLAENKLDEAEYVFKLNIKNYPNSSNVYDSMGDCNLVKGENEKAIQNFKKALSIDGSVEETKTKLDALLKK